MRFQLNSFLKRYKSHEIEHIILSRDPELKDEYTMHFILDHSAQIDALDRIRPDLLDFVRAGLKNYSINVSYSVSESNQSKRPYTLNEKVQYLIEQNPQIAEFKKRFGLDTDY